MTPTFKITLNRAAKQVMATPAGENIASFSPVLLPKMQSESVWRKTAKIGCLGLVTYFPLSGK